MRRLPPALLALALVVGCGAINAGTATTPASNAPAAGSTGSPAAPIAEPTPEITPTPRPSEIELRVKTLEKNCFGSAGCNVTYTIRVTLARVLPADVTYSVTYKVTGGDDPQIGTFTLTGDQATISEQEFIQTPSSSSVLRAKVTEVEAV